MSLGTLRIQDLRCLSHAELELHPGLNLVVGENASGKTTLLESIYLLGRGRSFRTRHTERLIRDSAQALQVFGRLEPSDSTLGFTFDRVEGASARINQTTVASLAELSAAFPVQVIDPGIHRLIEEGPVFRRRWLDWGVFHVEPNFAREWSRYSRALRQRNAALKLGSATAPWDDELAPLAESLTQARQKVLAELAVPWAEALQGLDLPAVTLQFHRGWSVERSFAESLALNASRDRERGSTGMGPHRFDVLPKLAGRAAREVLSRGQQKLLGAAMALSIAALVADRSGATPTLLVDDPAAELDERHTAALLQQIRTLEGQLVFTSLSRDNHALGVPDRWFHVEHGEVNQL